MSPEICTTEARRKRHLSLALEPDKRAPRMAGRRGRTLCGGTGFDQERADALAKQWNGKAPVIADLPECELCRRSAARRA